MSPDAETLAAAAQDAYSDRQRSDTDPVHPSHVNFHGHQYTVFGYKNDPVTGFHATAYWNKSTNEIIIAYRGTDPDIKHHTLTTAQDILVDATMVRDRINPQEADARAFTRAMIDKAARYGIGKDQITVAGHSLGGTLAEIEAWEFGLGGATFNAYGAVGLGYGISEGGTRLTDYVMAGDVVSAASPHYGTVVPLASNDDVLALKAGRYADVAPGMPPRNPFLAMRLSDHGNTHFAPAPGSHEASVLQPGMIEKYTRNYADHKAEFDAFRADVQRERGELAAALREAHHGHDGVVLPADVRRQLDEYLAVNADPAIRHAVEGNAWVRGAEHGLQQGAGMVNAGGTFVQQQDERTAALVRQAGVEMEFVNPAAPLVGVAVGEAAHWHGQAAHAASQLVAENVRSVEHAIEQDAHLATRAIKATIHSPALQDKVTGGVNRLVDAYRGAESAARRVEVTYENARRTLSQTVDTAEHAVARAAEDTYEVARHGIDAMERAAHDAYETATHPAEGFGQTVERARPQPGLQSFSDPAHPQHALHTTLRGLLPAATTEARLAQATAACRLAGINKPEDLAGIYSGGKGKIVFTTNSLFANTAAMDVSKPAPTVQQSLQQVQQFDRQQAQLRAHYASQAQAHLQHGPAR